MKPAAKPNNGAGKWGVAALAGFQPLPDVLLLKQKELGLDAVDIIVLLNVTHYWWFRDRPPYLRTNLIAERMDVTGRTIQRVIKKLQEKGYIRREKWTDEKGETYPAIFFDGLIRKLEVLACADPRLEQRIQKAQAKNDEQMEGF